MRKQKRYKAQDPYTGKLKFFTQEELEKHAVDKVPEQEREAWLKMALDSDPLTLGEMVME